MCLYLSIRALGFNGSESGKANPLYNLDTYCRWTSFKPRHRIRSHSRLPWLVYVGCDCPPSSCFHPSVCVALSSRPPRTYQSPNCPFCPLFLGVAPPPPAPWHPLHSFRGLISMSSQPHCPRLYSVEINNFLEHRARFNSSCIQKNATPMFRSWGY